MTQNEELFSITAFIIHQIYRIPPLLLKTANSIGYHRNIRLETGH